MGLIDTAVAVALGGTLLLAAYALYYIVQRLKAGQDGVVGTVDDVPALEVVEQALQPYISRAIVAGERALVWGLDDLKQKLAGIDKQAVANAFYALLPDYISIDGVAVPISVIKRVVSADDFYQLIKDAYDQTNAFIQRNEDYLRDQIGAFKTAVAQG